MLEGFDDTSNEYSLYNVEMTFLHPEDFGALDGRTQLQFFNAVLRTSNRNDAFNPTMESDWKTILNQGVLLSG